MIKQCGTCQYWTGRATTSEYTGMCYHPYDDPTKIGLGMFIERASSDWCVHYKRKAPLEGLVRVKL